MVPDKPDTAAVPAFVVAGWVDVPPAVPVPAAGVTGAAIAPVDSGNAGSRSRRTFAT